MWHINDWSQGWNAPCQKSIIPFLYKCGCQLLSFDCHRQRRFCQLWMNCRWLYFLDLDSGPMGLALMGPPCQLTGQWPCHSWQATGSSGLCLLCGLLIYLHRWEIPPKASDLFNSEWWQPAHMTCNTWISGAGWKLLFSSVVCWHPGQLLGTVHQEHLGAYFSLAVWVVW